MREKAAPVRFAVLRLLGPAVACVALVLVSAGGVHAQVPGPNINIVSGTGFPDGDPFLQRQNEPSIAISTRNPCHLLAGANDYRPVDAAGVVEDDATGDAWLGLFKSFDCGRTWKSNLIPGWPFDKTADGKASPLFGLAAGADPIVRAGAGGMFYYSGIAFDRGSNGKSKVFVARFIDTNLAVAENGTPKDPIVYAGTAVVDSGTSGQFIDKPSIAVDAPRNNGATCTVNGESVPGGTVYIAWADFVGQVKNNNARLRVAQSTDCGATWTRPAKVSEGLHTNQGAMLAVAPNGTVYVAWRQFAYDDQPDAIIVSRSTDFGRTFSKPQTIATISPFDQGTSGVSFRTNTYPTMAIDGANRVYVAWSARGFATPRSDAKTGDARVVMSTSEDGTTWTAPWAVEQQAPQGHQIMPALAFAAGRLQLIYYDLRDDHSYLVYQPADGTSYGYTPSRQAVGDPPEKVFWQQIAETDPTGVLLQRRHTIDVRGAQAPAGPSPAFTSWPISQYLFGVAGPNVEQMQFNPPNLPLYAKGSAPFIGDYIDVAGLSFVPKPGGSWAFNTDSTGTQFFQAVWTDNRDVRPPIDSSYGWDSYTPPNSPHTTKPCVPGRAGMRNANIYTSQIAPRLIVDSPDNAKALDPTTPRAFPIVVWNTTDEIRVYHLTLDFAAGSASFLETESRPDLYVKIAAHSSIARTVFAKSSQPAAQPQVQVTEVAAVDSPTPAPGGSAATLTLNADVTSPAITNPAITNPAITNQTFNPAITNPAITNPAITNPDPSNPAITNPAITNPAITNPAITNPAITNPAITNPAITNPAITNTTVQNGVITDVTWTVKNTGSQAGSFAVKVLLKQDLPPGFRQQLILHKRYAYPAATAGCDLGQTAQDAVIANIVNPTLPSLGNVPAGSFADPAITNPELENATLALAPGEEAQITLRIADPDRSDNTVVVIDGRPVSVDEVLDPTTVAVPAAVSQAANVVNGTPAPPADQPVALPSTLAFVQQPVAAYVAAPIVPAVTVRALDSQGAAIAGATITLSVVAGPGGAALSGGTAVTDATGTATFATLSLDTQGTGYQLQAASASMVPARSSVFDVSLKLRQLVSAPALTGLPNTLGFSSTGADAMNAAGDYLYLANYSAVFLRRSSGTTSRVLQMADPVPGIPGSRADIMSGLDINAAGESRVEIDYYLPPYIGHAILGYDGSAFRTIANSFDTAPGAGGLPFGRAMSLIGLNDPGDTAFTAPLVPYGSTSAAQTTIFIARAAGSIVRIAGPGDSAPGTGGGTLDQISALAFNNSGEVVFTAAVTGGSGGWGLFVVSTGGIRKIVANGDPDLASGTFTITNSSALASVFLNNAGQVAFLYSPPPPDVRRLYLSSPSPGGLALSVGPGTTLPWPGATLIGISGASLNDSGDLAVVTTQSGTSVPNTAVLRLRLGILTAVAWRGQASPIAGRTFSSFSSPFIDAAGDACFFSNLSGSPAQSGLFKADTGSPVNTTTLVASGQAAPPAVGGTFGFSGPYYYTFKPDGSVSFQSAIVGGTAGYGAFRVSSSGTTVLASDADLLPSPSRVVMREALWMSGTAGNYVPFKARYAGGAAATYVHNLSTGVTTRLVAEGEAAPGGGARVTYAHFGHANAGGRLAFTLSLADTAWSASLYTWTAGDLFQRLVATGDAAPVAGQTFNTLSQLPALGPSPINDAGQVVFRATLSVSYPPTPPAHLFLQTDGVFVAQAGVPVAKVAVTGDPAPGGIFEDFQGVCFINHSGAVAFQATTGAADVDSDAQAGIFIGTPGGTPTKIARVGDLFGGATFASFPSPAPLGLSDAGEVVFYATLSSGTGGLFMWSSADGLRALALDGQPAVAGGNYAIVPGASGMPVDAEMNAAGDIVFVVPLTGGSANSGLFLRRAGTGLVEAVVLQGQSAPGTSGVFATILRQINSIPGEMQVLGPSGEVLLDNGVTVTGFSSLGLFRYRADRTLEKVLMRAEAVPDGRSGTVASFSQMSGRGDQGRFFFAVLTTEGTSSDGIYTTAIAGDTLAVGGGSGGGGAQPQPLVPFPSAFAADVMWDSISAGTAAAGAKPAPAATAGAHAGGTTAPAGHQPEVTVPAGRVRR